MKRSLLDVLVCPRTHSPLTLFEFETIQEENKFTGSKHERILFGVLKNASNYCYPIVNGMPRIIEGALKIYENRLAQYKSKIDALSPHPDSYSISENFRKNFLPTQKRFELEWREHDLQGTTWAMDQPGRMKKYREFMNLQDSEYPGKLFLDIGAGTGQFICTLADSLNCEVIAIDLSPSLERGEMLRRSIKNSSHINFIQANLMELPFKPGTFDCMHASGVLHHTPDTRKAFEYTEQFAKTGGKFGVWLYRIVHDTFPLLPLINFPKFNYLTVRKISTKINPTLLYYLFYSYAAFFHLAYKINQLLRGVKHTRTIKEHVTGLFDCFAPPYAFQHKPEEVKQWFEEKHYTQIIETDQENFAGFNMSGVKNK